MGSFTLTQLTIFVQRSIEAGIVQIISLCIQVKMSLLKVTVMMLMKNLWDLLLLAETRLPYSSLATSNRQVGTMRISGGMQMDIDRDCSLRFLQ